MLHSNARGIRKTLIPSAVYQKHTATITTETTALAQKRASRLPRPAWRLRPLVTTNAAQTAPMHDGVVRQHGDDTATAPHATAQSSVAHNAQPLVCNGDMSVASPAAAAAAHDTTVSADVELGGDSDALGFTQRCHDPRLADHAVG